MRIKVGSKTDEKKIFFVSDNFFNNERQVISMASKRTIDERIQEKDNMMQQLLTKAKQYEAQIRQLEKRKKEEERKARTHRLITIGGAVSAVLGRDFVEGDDMRLMNFLKQQERNGNYFSKAMNKGAPDTAKNDKEPDAEESLMLKKEKALMKMQILMKRMRILRVIHEMRGSAFVIPFTSGRAHLYMGGAHIIPLRFATLVRR